MRTTCSTAVGGTPTKFLWLVVRECAVPDCGLARLICGDRQLFAKYGVRASRGCSGLGLIIAFQVIDYLEEDDLSLYDVQSGPSAHYSEWFG